MPVNGWDIIPLVVLAYVWNRYMSFWKQAAFEATGHNISLPDNIVSNAATGAVKDGLVAAFLEVLWMYWSLPWWWHLITAFVFYIFFDKQCEKLWSVVMRILKWCLLIMTVLLGGFWDFITTPAAAPAAPAVAPTKKSRARSPAPVPEAPVPDAPVADPVADPAVAPPKSARAKSARAKSPRAKRPVHYESPGIEEGTEVIAMHVKYGKKKFLAMVMSIDGDSCVIAWADGDTTDTLKQIKDLELYA